MRRTALCLLGALFLLAPAAAQVAPGYEIKPADRSQGNAKAKVVLIEYGAFSCSHCADFNTEVMPQVKKKYIDTGKVLYVFRLFPRSAEDGIGEKMARCVPGKYFTVADIIFRNHAKWAEFGVADPAGELKKLGLKGGLTQAQIDKCVADKSDEARINKVGQEALDRYSLEGTPTFVINGVTVEPAGGLPYAELAKRLDKALSPAK